jgi:Cu2+-exporting ATPase
MKVSGFDAERRPSTSSRISMTPMHVIRRNIAFSLVYNVIGATLAMTGVINPLIAAIMMPASSLTVVLGSRLGKTFEEPADTSAVIETIEHSRTPAIGAAA